MSFGLFQQIFSNQGDSKPHKDIASMNYGQLEIDSQFIVQKSYSQVIDVFLGHEQLAGRNFAGILKSRISPNDYKNIIPLLKALVTDNDVIKTTRAKNPFDCLKVSIPTLGGKQATKYLRCEFTKSKNFSKTGYWTVIVRDISKSVRISKTIRRTTEKAELKVNTVMSLIQFEKDLIREFLESTTYALKEILKNLSSLSKDKIDAKQRLECIYCIVHQIKGDAGILNLMEISTQAHQIESILSVLNTKRDLGNHHLRQLSSPLKDIIASVIEVKSLFEQIAEGSWNESNGGGGDSMTRRLKHLTNKIASDNNKRVIVIDDAYQDSAVPLHLRRVVNSLVTQLARNAIVHGIEKPTVRVKQHKTPYGCLHVGLSQKHGNLIVTVRDDGQGIDLKRIKNIALNSPLFNRQQVGKWSNKEVLNALFKQGFSTATTLTQHAGRGVGLDVIKSTVEKYQGTIGIKSIFGHFTEFTMRFPIAART